MGAMPLKLLRLFFRHVVLVAVAFILLLPFFWLLSSSLKTNVEIFSQEMKWIPAQFIWKNYVEGWRALPPYTYTLFFKNSFILAFTVIIGTLLTSPLIAFAFARIPFRFRNFWFIVLLSTLMLPHQVTMIPIYILWTRLGFVNTYVPLVAGAFFGNAFYIFLIRQFITGIPYELDEAAICDGCSYFRIYRTIILPLSTPVLVTVILFAFSGSYDDFMGPLIYINQVKKFPVSLALRMFVDIQGVMEWGPILAMTLVCMLPLLVVFLFTQRHLVEGIATTGIKG